MADEKLTLATWFEQVRDRIAQDHLDEALSMLRALLEGSPKLDEVLHQSGRFAAICQQIRLGTVSHAEANQTRNQISAALLELLREIETKQTEAPALRDEMAQAISVINSKNPVVNSTIQAGGEVHIGDRHIIIIQGATDHTLTVNVDG